MNRKKNVCAGISFSNSAKELLKSDDPYSIPPISGTVPSTSKRDRKVVFTPKMLSSLGRANISDSQAVLIVASVVSVTEENIDENPLNFVTQENIDGNPK